MSNEQKLLLTELTTENVDRRKIHSNTGWISVLAKKAPKYQEHFTAPKLLLV